MLWSADPKICFAAATEDFLSSLVSNVHVNIKICLTVFGSTVNAAVLFTDSSQVITDGSELID
jgi:hypothetical protein